MPKVVGVHGISNEFEGPASLKAAWLPKLRDGLSLAKRMSLNENDFACVFYGDRFRRTGGKSVGLPRLQSTEVIEAEEIEVLHQWCVEARRVEGRSSTIPDPFGDASAAKGRAPRGAQWLLQQLSKSKFFMAAGGDAFILWLLKQVRGYFRDDSMRRLAQSRIAEVVDRDTSVIVGHSLGSVVAYEALCAHPEWNVTTFVSLGSPLGIANLVFDRLNPTPQNGVGVWPKVQNWINIADEGDIVALQKDLRRCFGSSVKDVPIYNGWESHSVLRYLTAKETGEAIATGLE